MISIEDAIVLRCIRGEHELGKGDIASCLASRYSVAIELGGLSAIVDKLRTSGYLMATQTLPRRYSVSKSGDEALQEFDNLINLYNKFVGNFMLSDLKHLLDPEDSLPPPLSPHPPVGEP
jgi:hypothetical protein